MSNAICYNFTFKPSYLFIQPEILREDGETMQRRGDNRHLLNVGQKRIGISDQVRKKMTEAIEWMLICALPKTIWSDKYKKFFSFKLNFITLTIPYNGVSANPNEVKKALLGPFIKACKYRWKLNNYLWKMELTKQNQVHLHFVTDTYIEKLWLSKKWNHLLYKNGYLNKYLAKNGHINAPSTNVKAVHNANEAAKYVRKYVAKNVKLKDDGNGKMIREDDVINGRIWGSNYEISRKNALRLTYFVNEPCNIDNDMRTAGKQLVDVLTKPDFTGNRHVIGSIYQLSYDDWKGKIKGETGKLMRDHVFNMRNHSHLFSVINKNQPKMKKQIKATEKAQSKPVPGKRKKPKSTGNQLALLISSQSNVSTKQIMNH